MWDSAAVPSDAAVHGVDEFVRSHRLSENARKRAVIDRVSTSVPVTIMIGIARRSRWARSSRRTVLDRQIQD
jgi:hypothetical protein